MCNSEGLNLGSNFLHSDGLKFEMERSDWSCAYCRQGRHEKSPIIAQMSSTFCLVESSFTTRGRHGVIVSTDLIGREPSRYL